MEYHTNTTESKIKYGTQQEYVQNSTGKCSRGNRESDRLKDLEKITPTWKAAKEKKNICRQTSVVRSIF